MLERLAAAGIRLVPLQGLETHFVFERDGFVAIVERAGDGLGQIGSAGLLTEKGFAALVWKEGKAFFVAKGLERPASEEQVVLLRRFDTDLRQALRCSPPRASPKSGR